MIEADHIALVETIKRIQEIATDLPEGTLAEAQKALSDIWDECDLRLAVSVKEDDEPCHGPEDTWCPSCGLGGDNP